MPSGQAIQFDHPSPAKGNRPAPPGGLRIGGDQVATRQSSDSATNQPVVLRPTPRMVWQPVQSTGKSSRTTRFREADMTDLVLEYYRWDTIYMKRPDAHEGPFLTIFTRDNIVSEVSQRVSNHNLAVVVLGYIYTPEQEENLFRDWQSLLGDCGFKHVVFLRGGKSKKIDGLPIILDSVIAEVNDSGKAVATVASVSSAP